jgi:hypothetical protein
MGKKKRDPNWPPRGRHPGPIQILELPNLLLKPGDPIPPPIDLKPYGQSGPADEDPPGHPPGKDPA